jgi:hypothetical protein
MELIYRNRKYSDEFWAFLKQRQGRLYKESTLIDKVAIEYAYERFIEKYKKEEKK